ncbi:MAG: methionine gamma-lyase [Caldibacillus debilis]|uniref:L-methionine gamma-lyase n=1 Tax=Caldibacillus debilis TaxID=301148 RepID=A0A3E0K736_9BACI|nr:methionine gamma-lyase [Caldibacillus debilis]MBO2482735.1 methionine gamma-lyase [Bacillaceae bacterium]MBY6272992.1 methionine gamma-lyase [Bacillaceae bacterium]REJ29989.1 MAG: methionine gamma-lyase [Caldibacillus debilis]
MDYGNRMETMLIHSGYDARDYKDSLSPPLYLSSTFVFPTAEQGEQRFSGKDDGFIYSRLANPTVRILEERMAALEKGEDAIAFASGMAAVSAVLLHLTKAGDHILCSRGIYGCTFGLLRLFQEKNGITYSFCSMTDEKEIEAGLRENTACIFLETPVNPTMEVNDLELVVKVARRRGIPVVVDNTFSSPYLQNPLEFGCDYVVHSATKYIGGHGDVIAGIVVGKDREAMQQLRNRIQKDIGGIISPFDAWLLLRGLKTLHVRMDRHVENAKKLFEYLKTVPLVEKIFYPGDPENKYYPVVKKQMRAPGAMLSFTVKGGREMAQALIDALKMVKIAVSLGDAETLIQHPATMTHSAVPAESREAMGITDNMLRLSVGLEAAEDIIEDFRRAFQKAERLWSGKKLA